MSNDYSIPSPYPLPVYALSKADEALRVIIEKEESDVIEIADALEEKGLTIRKYETHARIA